jgi:hypothetical protein
MATGGICVTVLDQMAGPPGGKGVTQTMRVQQPGSQQFSTVTKTVLLQSGPQQDAHASQASWGPKGDTEALVPLSGRLTHSP